MLGWKHVLVLALSAVCSVWAEQRSDPVFNITTTITAAPNPIATDVIFGLTTGENDVYLSMFSFDAYPSVMNAAELSFYIAPFDWMDNHARLVNSEAEFQHVGTLAIPAYEGPLPHGYIMHFGPQAASPAYPVRIPPRMNVTFMVRISASVNFWGQTIAVCPTSPQYVSEPPLPLADLAMYTGSGFGSDFSGVDGVCYKPQTSFSYTTQSPGCGGIDNQPQGGTYGSPNTFVTIRNTGSKYATINGFQHRGRLALSVEAYVAYVNGSTAWTLRTNRCAWTRVAATITSDTSIVFTPPLQLSPNSAPGQPTPYGAVITIYLFGVSDGMEMSAEGDVELLNTVIAVSQGLELTWGFGGQNSGMPEAFANPSLAVGRPDINVTFCVSVIGTVPQPSNGVPCVSSSSTGAARSSSSSSSSTSSTSSAQQDPCAITCSGGVVLPRNATGLGSCAQSTCLGVPCRVECAAGFVLSGALPVCAAMGFAPANQLQCVVPTPFCGVAQILVNGGCTVDGSVPVSTPVVVSFEVLFPPNTPNRPTPESVFNNPNLLQQFESAVLNDLAEALGVPIEVFSVSGVQLVAEPPGILVTVLIDVSGSGLPRSRVNETSIDIANRLRDQVFNPGSGFYDGDETRFVDPTTFLAELFIVLTSESIWYAVLVVLGLLILITLLWVWQRRQFPDADNWLFFSVLWSLLAWASNISFVVFLGDTAYQNGVADFDKYFWVAFVFLVIPFVFNLTAAFLIIAREKAKNPGIAQYAREHGCALWTFWLLGGIKTNNLRLSLSGILGLEFLQAPWRVQSDLLLKSLGLVGTLLTDMPLAILMIVLLQVNHGYSTRVLFPLCTNVVSVTIALITRGLSTAKLVKHKQHQRSTKQLEAANKSPDAPGADTNAPGADTTGDSAAGEKV